MTAETLQVGVFVSGRGSNLKALLEAKAAGGLDQVRFALVFSDKDSPLAFDHAHAHEVGVYHVNPKAFKKKADYEAAVLEKLEGAGVNFIVLAGYMRIVGPTLLEAYEGRMINIHPSLLPAFPGLHAQKQALDNGAKESGCTVHFVDAGVDSGPIILQRAVPCLPDDSEDTLSARILKQEHQALPEALRLISEGLVTTEGRTVIVSESEK